MRKEYFDEDARLCKLKRHFQRYCHFRADQRLREKICPGKFRGHNGSVLYGSKLEAERELYVELDLPNLSHKRPFHYVILEGKPLTLTTEEARIRIQINLLTIVLRSVGQLWALDDYWIQVGVATGHSASIAVFNWSPARIYISNFGLSSGLYCNWVFYHFFSLRALRLLPARNFVLVGHKTDVVPLF